MTASDATAKERVSQRIKERLAVPQRERQLAVRRLTVGEPCSGRLVPRLEDVGEVIRRELVGERRVEEERTNKTTRTAKGYHVPRAGIEVER